MTRTIPTAVQTELDNHANGEPLRTSLLLFVDFDSDPLYVWTGVGDLDYNGNTYQGVGGMGSVAQVIEDGKLSEVKFDVSLTSIPQANLPDLVDAVTTGNPNGRDFSLDLAFFDDTTASVGVLPLTSGFVDGATIVESSPKDGEIFGSVNLALSSESSRLSHNKFIRMTNTAQQNLFTGDLGLEFVNDTALSEILWGQKASVATQRISGGGGLPYWKNGGGDEYL